MRNERNTLGKVMVIALALTLVSAGAQVSWAGQPSGKGSSGTELRAKGRNGQFELGGKFRVIGSRTRLQGEAESPLNVTLGDGAHVAFCLLHHVTATTTTTTFLAKGNVVFVTLEQEFEAEFDLDTAVGPAPPNDVVEGNILEARQPQTGNTCGGTLIVDATFHPKA